MMSTILATLTTEKYTRPYKSEMYRTQSEINDACGGQDARTDCESEMRSMFPAMLGYHTAVGEKCMRTMLQSIRNTYPL